MPERAAAEVYFIAAMMVLILVVSFAAVYFFFRQYRKEMRDKAGRLARSSRPDKGAEGGPISDDEEQDRIK